MKNILIFEPFVSGHRMHYLRYLVEEIARRDGIRAHLVVDEGSGDHSQVSTLIDAFPDCVRLVKVDASDPPNRITSQSVKRWVRQRQFSKLINSTLLGLSSHTKIDYVFIPFLDDYCHYVTALQLRPFGRIKWGGIVIRPRHHLASFGIKAPRRWIDYIDRIAYWLLLRHPTLDRLFSIDEYFCQYYSSGKLRAVADPADLVGKPASAMFPAKEGQVVLVVYGYIDKRKGLKELFEVVSHPSIPKFLHVLIAGKQDPNVAAVLNSDAANALRDAGRLSEISMELSDQAECALFQYADIVWVYYPGSYCSSGVLVRAGQSSKPVVATSEGLVGHVVSKVAMGITAPENAPDKLVAALVRLTTSPALRARMGAAGFAQFSTATTQRFGETIVSDIAATLDA